MANFRYLLESGAPDGYLLEDSSGVLILEESTGASGPTVSNMTAISPSEARRGKQHGFTDVGFIASTALVLLVALSPEPRDAVASNPVLKKHDQTVEQFENRLILSSAAAAVPEFGVYFPDFAPKKHDQQVEQLINEVIRTNFVDRGPLFNEPQRKKRYDQVEQIEFRAILDVSSAPFFVEDFGNFERKRDNAPDLVPNALLIQWPFEPPDSGWSERKREYQQLEQQPNPFAYNAILSAPFKPVTWPEFEKLPSYQEEIEQNPFAIGGTLERPFIAQTFPEFERRLYQQIEQQPNYFAFSNLLEAPFKPESVGFYEAKKVYQQIEQELNKFAVYGNLEAPFSLDQWPEWQRKRNYEPLFETSEFPAPFQILEEPFVPVEFPQTGQSKRDAQDYFQSSLDLKAMPFPSWDLGYYATKDEYQQIDPQQNVFAFNNLLEAPFVPEEFPNPVHKKLDAQDFIKFYFDAASAFAPFTPATFPEYERKLYQQIDQQPNYFAFSNLLEPPFSLDQWPEFESKLDFEPEFETSEFPAPFQILEEPFIPVMWPEFEKLQSYQDEPQQNPFALGGSLERPFIPVTWPEFEKLPSYQEELQQNYFALTGALEAPFKPITWPEFEKLQSYQDEQQQNPFVISNSLEAPFVPEEFPNPTQKKYDAQDFIAFYFDTSNAFAPFTPVTFPEYERSKLYQQIDPQQNYFAFNNLLEAPFVLEQWPEFESKLDFEPEFETSEFPAPFQILERPFIPVTWPEFEKLQSYQDEQQPNPFAFRNELERPFIPIDFPRTGEAKRDAQDYFQSSLDLEAMPFPSWDLGYYATKYEYLQIPQQPNYFAFRDLLELPFIPEAFPNPEPRKLDAQDFVQFYFDETNAFNPFVPVEFPQTGQAKRDAQDHISFYFDSENAFVPFFPVTWPEFEPKLDAQDFASTNLYPLYQILAVPFLPEEFLTPERRLYQQIDQFEAAILIQWPFIPATFPEYERKPQYQQEQEQNKFASYGILATPFVPPTFPEFERKAQYQEEQAQNYYAVFAILERPFVPQEFLTPERGHYEQTEQAQRSYTLYGAVAAPFIPYDFVQADRARQLLPDVSDTSSSLLIQWPTIPTDLSGQGAERTEYQQIDQPPNTLIPLVQSFVYPYGRQEFPQPDRTLWDRTQFFEQPQNLYPIQSYVQPPFVPYDFPQHEPYQAADYSFLYEAHGSPLALLAIDFSMEPKVFYVQVNDRVYVVPRDERVYFSDQKNVYGVEVDDREYPVDPNDRTYGAE